MTAIRDRVNKLGIDVNCVSIAPAARWLIADVVFLIFSSSVCLTFRLSLKLLSFFLVNFESNNTPEVVNIHRVAKIFE